jgi:enoyl-CoA hydratase/carnithine racemase
LLLRNAERLDAATAWAENDKEFARLLASDDGREGPQAFAERRAPQWVGR